MKAPVAHSGQITRPLFLVAPLSFVSLMELLRVAFNYNLLSVVMSPLLEHAMGDKEIDAVWANLDLCPDLRAFHETHPHVFSNIGRLSFTGQDAGAPQADQKQLLYGRGDLSIPYPATTFDVELLCQVFTHPT